MNLKLLKIIFLFICFSVTYTAYSQGVAFLKTGNLRTVFELAKSQNKDVLIEIYSPGCHICQGFMPTFDQKPVGDFFNKSFVSYKLDIDSEEAQGFLGKQKIWIPSIPTMLFYDKSINLNHITVLSENRNSAQVLLDAGKTALNPQKRVSNYKKIFQEGTRTPDFLIEFGLMARIQKDTLTNLDAANAYFKTQKVADYTNSTNLLVLEKIILDDENGLFKYMINNLPKYYAKKDKAKINALAENILMWSLYSSRGQKFTSTKIAQTKLNLSKVGVDQKSISGRVWIHEASAFFRENNGKAAINIMENRIKGMTMSKNEASYLCKFVRSKTIDKYALAAAAKWCKIAN